MRILLIGGSGFIGKHLSRKLVVEGHAVTIADKIIDTGDSAQQRKVCDLLDLKKSDFEPSNYDVIINLAAKTDDSSEILEDYKVNYIGVHKLLQTLQSENFYGLFVQISTQYVRASKEYNKSSRHGNVPVNTYGQSKLIAEELILSSNLKNWLILRPTNIWGPGHKNFPTGFWKVIERGLYLHPSHGVYRSYGSVFTVVEQIHRFITSENRNVRNRIYYLGNEPIDSLTWVNGFSLSIRGRKVLRVHKSFLFLLALFGNGFERLTRRRFPINLKRFKSMTTNYVVNMQDTHDAVGLVDTNFDDEIRETSEWYLKEYGKNKAR